MMGTVDRIRNRAGMTSSEEGVGSNMNRSEVKAVAAELHDYMKFRATKENQVYELDTTFFESRLKMGCLAFYGIVVDETG
jgi:hypothetical protein